MLEECAATSDNYVNRCVTAMFLKTSLLVNKEADLRLSEMNYDGV